MGIDQWHVAIARCNALDGQGIDAHDVLVDGEQVGIADCERYERHLGAFDDKGELFIPDGIESVAANGRRLEVDDVVVVVDADVDEGTRGRTAEKAEGARKVLAAEHHQLHRHRRHPDGGGWRQQKLGLQDVTARAVASEESRIGR